MYRILLLGLLIGCGEKEEDTSVEDTAEETTETEGEAEEATSEDDES